MRPILSFPKYFADDYGYIWRDGKRLKNQIDKKGYARVSPSINGMVYKTRLVSRLVAEAYHGKCPYGMECRHLNGNQADNRPSNLAWSDKATNEADKKVHGTNPFGERNAQAILTEEIVVLVRNRVRAGERQDDIARELGMPRATIADAVMGRRWKHLSGALEKFSTRRRFTADQVKEIRRRAATEPQSELAREFNVTQSNISMIANKITYQHV